MKNIVLFHLESLNNVIFNMNQECFPNLRNFIKDATYYPNYYSTATSTYMVITDLFFGDTFQFEQSDYLEDIFSVKAKKESIFDLLSKYGYKTKCYCYGDQEKELARKKMKIFCSAAPCWESVNDQKGLITDIENFLKTDKQFAIFIKDVESHWMNLEWHKQVSGFKSSQDLFKYKYYMLDKTFGKVMEAIKNSGQYENTLVIAYGDHGDEFFGHGLHDGYTHAIEPFPFMVNCPLVIGNTNVALKGSVISTIDIYEIIMSALHNKVYESSRSFAFSRNLFSKQKVSIKSFNKSYMATDGKYSLQVSKKGLSLFWCQADICNGRNLLDFFSLVNGRLMYRAIYNNLKSSHYKYIMNKDAQEDINNEFYILLNKLRNFVDSTYGREIDDLNFSKINYSSDVCSSGWKFRLYSRSILKKMVSLIKRVFGVQSITETNIGKKLYKLFI